MTASPTIVATPLSDTEVIHRSRPAARGFVAGLLVVLLCGIAVLLARVPAFWKLLAACLIPAAGAVLVVCAALLCRRGTDRATGIAYWVGILLIWLSTAFDISVTVLHSSDLTREANPFFRVLLDQRYPLPLVYAYVALILLGSCVALSLGWTAMFRHRGPWLRQSFAASPDSLPGFWKAATGGSALTWRQYFLPLNWSDQPQAYPSVLSAAVVLVVLVTLAHVRAGLEWLGLIPTLRWWHLGPELVPGLAMFLLWLAWRYHRLQARARETGHDSNASNARVH